MLLVNKMDSHFAIFRLGKTEIFFLMFAAPIIVQGIIQLKSNAKEMLSAPTWKRAVVIVRLLHLFDG